MFTSISIRNFRCFEAFSIASLDRVNLIAGENNVGKTALLEAIFLLIGTANVSLVARISAFRGIEVFKGDPGSVAEILWSPIFFNFNNRTKAKVCGSFRSGGEQKVELELIQAGSTPLTVESESSREIEQGTDDFSGETLQLTYSDPSGKTLSTRMLVEGQEIRTVPVPPKPPFPGFFITARRRTSLQEDAQRFGKLEVAEESHYLLEALRVVEPRLKRIATIAGASVPMLYGDIGFGRMLPIALMGDGLGRLTSILLTIANAPGGVVLVDEIENGLHHAILRKVWQAIGEAARRFDTQVFATTHSWECIHAAHQAFESSATYDFRLHRLDRIDDGIQAVTYDREMLATAIATDLEVR